MLSPCFQMDVDDIDLGVGAGGESPTYRGMDPEAPPFPVHMHAPVVAPRHRVLLFIKPHPLEPAGIFTALPHVTLPLPS